MKLRQNVVGAALFEVYFALFCIALAPWALLGLALYAMGAPRERLGNLWYNQDRTLASGRWGTSQETISSEVGRIALGAGKPDGWTPKWRFEARWAAALAGWLNNTPRLWGVDHTGRAIEHADRLEGADDGREQ